MEIFAHIVSVGNRLVWASPAALPWLVVLLLGAGLFVTTRLRFVQVRRLTHGIAALRGAFDDPDDAGDVSHFQALATALSATVGIGNIAGVAIAIHYGGPGALLWMWVTAAFGMALKFAECTLSLHYRTFDEAGNVAGGPMYYIERGLGRSWKPLAVAFAACAMISSFGGGNMAQANTVAVSARADLGVPAWLAGAALTVLVGAVVLGGIRSIARVASKLAPAMAILYVSAGFLVLVLRIGAVPHALATIIADAFHPRAGFVGTAAGGLVTTMLWGVKRGLFSNEAGLGSAPIAHAAARTEEPVREGVVAMLGPFIDTIIICTMTGLIIVTTGVWNQKKPDRRPLAAAHPALRRGGTHAGAVHAAVTPRGITVAVTDGSQRRLRFRVDDAAVAAPRVVRTDGSAFSGEIAFDESGTASARTAGGAEVRVFVAGKMAETSSALTSWAFEKGLSPLGDWGDLVVTVCVFLFAVSTMISWSYYGDRCAEYLAGYRAVRVYRIVFIGFVYLGATIALKTVWAYGDLALGLMAVPNLVAVLLLSPRVVRLSRDYFARMEA